jgi:hypothetical protein
VRLILKRRFGHDNSAPCAQAMKEALGALPADHRAGLKFSTFGSRVRADVETLIRDAPAEYGPHIAAALDRYYFVDGIRVEVSAQLLARLSVPELFEVCRMDRASGSQQGLTPFAARTGQPIPQNYLKEAPIGVDSFFARSQTGGDGESVAFVVIEKGFAFGHPDLGPVTVLYGNPDSGPGSEAGHGTATMGILCSSDDGGGTIGLVPRAAAKAAAVGQSESEIASAIVSAAASVKPGSILLLATQTEDRLPSETNELIFDAIRLAVASRRIVVEAAGDGGINFDTYHDASGRQILNPASPDFRHSGAILVAGCQDEMRLRSEFTNYGARVDCYGWSRAVASTCPPDGYAHASGTAAAAAIVAGCAVSLQGMHRCRAAKVLDPPALRSLLVKNGTHPLRVQERIGTMPDLRRAFNDIHLAQAASAV